MAPLTKHTESVWTRRFARMWCIRLREESHGGANRHTTRAMAAVATGPLDAALQDALARNEFSALAALSHEQELAVRVAPASSALRVPDPRDHSVRRSWRRAVPPSTWRWWSWARSCCLTDCAHLLAAAKLCARPPLTARPASEWRRAFCGSASQSPSSGPRTSRPCGRCFAPALPCPALPAVHACPCWPLHSAALPFCLWTGGENAVVVAAEGAVRRSASTCGNGTSRRHSPRPSAMSAR